MVALKFQETHIADESLVGEFVQLTIMPHAPGQTREASGYLRRAEPIPGSEKVFVVLEYRPGQYGRHTVTRGERALRTRRYVCERCIRQKYLGEGGPAHHPLSTCRMGQRHDHCTCAGCW